MSRIYYSERHRARVNRWRKADDLKAIAVGLFLLALGILVVFDLYHSAKQEGVDGYKATCKPVIGGYFDGVQEHYYHCPQ